LALVLVDLLRDYFDCFRVDTRKEFWVTADWICQLTRPIPSYLISRILALVNIVVSSWEAALFGSNPECPNSK
jgi:hypothetical protein